jgi:hypothetical protein
VIPVTARPLSPAELEDPGLLERRRRQAAQFAAEGIRLEERIVRTYLDVKEPPEPE